jgi:hypothetical protein
MLHFWAPRVGLLPEGNHPLTVLAALRPKPLHPLTIRLLLATPLVVLSLGTRATAQQHWDKPGSRVQDFTRDRFDCLKAAQVPIVAGAVAGQVANEGLYKALYGSAGVEPPAGSCAEV